MKKRKTKSRKSKYIRGIRRDLSEEDEILFLKELEFKEDRPRLLSIFR